MSDGMDDMGAWGVTAFDNDDANDWADGLDDVSDLSWVESALSQVEDAEEYLEAPTASETLAACEVLARLLGRPGYQNAYTEKVDDWVRQHPIIPTPALLARAKSAIERILGENSELCELWQDSDDAEWQGAVADLRYRLGA